MDTSRQQKKLLITNIKIKKTVYTIFAMIINLCKLIDYYNEKVKFSLKFLEMAVKHIDNF